MKKLLLLIIIFVSAITTNAQVQRKASKEQSSAEMKHGKGMNKKALKAVGLTKKQRGEIKEIRNDYKTKMNTIKTNTALSEAEKKSMLKDLKVEQKEKISKVLTDEQKAKLKSDGAADNKPLPKRGVTDMPNEKVSK